MNALLKKSLAAGAVAGVLVSGNLTYAATGSGNVNAKIIVPAVLILDYYSDITVTLTDTDILDYMGVTAVAMNNSTAVNATATQPGGTGTAFEAAFNIPPTAPGTMNAVDLVLQNVWAVQGIGPDGGNITVAVTLPASPTTLTNAASDTIDVMAAAVSDGTSTGPSIGVPFPGLGSGVATKGDVTLTLDLSNATTTGTYSPAATTYTITASTP